MSIEIPVLIRAKKKKIERTSADGQHFRTARITGGRGQSKSRHAEALEPHICTTDPLVQGIYIERSGGDLRSLCRVYCFY